MIPSRLARRRARWGLAILLGLWAGFDAAIGILVRTHGINERCTGYTMGAGGIAWFLVFPVWFGMSWHARLVTHDGHGFVAGRTLTGPRAVDLDQLIKVRRFQALGRYGQTWDDLRLRDSWGVRLTINDDSAIETAIRHAIEVRAVRVSTAVKNRLGMSPARFGTGVRALLGLFTVVGSLAGCVVMSLLITCLIAGAPFNG
ncbi:MAG: hypothetical protein ACRDSS_02325 [Actinocrinis sp.]